MNDYSIRQEGKLYSVHEEIANTITHGVGALLSIVGAIILLTFSIQQGDFWKILSSAIYGCSMITLFTMSTLYHAFTKESTKKLFRVFDHTTISILIAGTYSPYIMVKLRTTMGWSIFAVVWALCILNIILKSISIDKYNKISLAGYLISGWAIIIIIVPLFKALTTASLILLIGGGVAYTSGLIFFGNERTHYMHAIWHAFVLAGAVLHFVSILLIIL